MVTIVILSVGLTAVLKTYIISLDQITHLTNRLYANTVLDNRLVRMEQHMKLYQALPFEMGRKDKVVVGVKTITFVEKMDIKGVEDYPDVFHVDLSMHWVEGPRNIQIQRTAYVSDFRTFKDY